MPQDHERKASLIPYGVGAAIGGAAGIGAFAASGKLDQAAKHFKKKHKKAEAAVGQVKIRSGKTKIVKSWIDKTNSGPRVAEKIAPKIKEVKKFFNKASTKKALIDNKDLFVKTTKRFKVAQTRGFANVSKAVSEVVRNHPVKLTLGSALLGSAFLSGAMQKEANISLKVKTFNKTAALNFGGILNAGKKLAEGIGKRIPGKAGELARAEVTHLPGVVAGAMQAVPKVNPANPLGIIKTYKPQVKATLTGLSTVNG